MVKQFREAQDVEEVISPTRLQTVDHQRPDGNALVEASFDGHRVMDAAVEPGRGSLEARFMELLGEIGSPQVKLEMAGELDPAIVRPGDGSDYLGVVMPMRL